MNKRYERKYLVPVSHLHELRKRFLSFTESDTYAIKSGKKIPEYTVRSIYFDSWDWDAYDEKLEGLRDRNKLRIRGYNEYKPGDKVFFEIKHKFENRIGKSRGKIPFEDMESFLHNGDIGKYYPNPESERHKDLQRFMYYYHRFNQRPVTTVTYEREPYFGKFDHGVRITFDKNIRANIFPELTDLYKEDNCQLLWPHYFILEIKYFTDIMPRWARSVIQEFGLRHEALSKYTQGIDINLTLNPLFNRAAI
jgi:SPX domain protein involved in polyphosphate accumulation